MASPAAVLSVLVQAEGINQTTRQVRGLHGDLDKADKNVGKFGKSLEDTGKRGSKALSGLKSAAGLAGVAFGAAGLAAGVKTAIGEYQEAVKVGAQTNAVIKSTGGAANVTAKHVADLATAISKKAGVDDEAIQSGSNLLLTFKGVRNEVGKGNDIFDQATQTITDMSASLKQGLKPSAIQLGKALNDPVKGITALSRVGVTFTEGQKKQITAMVKAGDTLGAQKIILKELKSEFGGSAASQATALDKLKVTGLNLAEAVGSVLVPAFNKAATFLNVLINQMIEGKSTGGAIVSVFRGLGGVIGTVVSAIQGIIAAFKEGKAWAVLLVTAVGALTAGFIAYKTIMLVATAGSKAMAAAQVAINVAMSLNPIGLVIAAIIGLVAGLVIAYKKSEAFRNIVNTVWDAIKSVTGAVWNFITSLKDLPGKLYDAGKAITEGVINGIKAVPGLLANAATWLWNKLKAGLESYLDAYKTVGGWVLARIVDGFKIVTDLLKSIGGWVKDRIVGFIKLEIDGIKAVGGWILNRVVDGFKIVTDLLKTVGGWIKNRIVEFIRFEVDAFTNIGSWIVNRVVDGFKTVTKALGTVGNWIKNRVVDFIKMEADGFKNVGSTIIGWIADGFKSGVNAVVDLVNKIIDVINVIPGIPNIKHVGHIGGSGGGKGKPGTSQGGVGHPNRAKGGMVPGHGSGDKVPLHIGGRLSAMVEPGELVSVANRNATAALMNVNKAVPRYATGGVFDSTSYGPPWTGINGTGVTATGVNLKSNPHTFGVAVDPSVIGLGSKLDIWPNPFNTHSKFQAFDTGSAIKGRHLDFYDWRGRSAQYGWGSRQVRVGGGATGPGIGNILGNLNPADLIKQLPGVGGLPDFLQGTGKYVLGKVGDYIKSHVVKAVTGAPSGPTASGPGGVGTYQGMPMANWVIGALKYGLQHGAFGVPTSGYRPGFDPHTASGRSEHQGTQYPHGAVDFGGYHDARALAEKLSYVHATAGYKYPLLAPAGFVDDGHASGTGHKLGGIVSPRLPFLGSYHTGGVAPREGLAHVSAGERMTPAGSGPLVNIEHAEFGSQIDVNSFAAKLGFKIATA